MVADFTGAQGFILPVASLGDSKSCLKHTDNFRL